jgi:hypothetical protein
VSSNWTQQDKTSPFLIHAARRFMEGISDAVNEETPCEPERRLKSVDVSNGTTIAID